MPHRSSHIENPPPPTVTLRRSPRFHQTEDPKTPKAETHRRTRSTSATPPSLTGHERKTRRCTSDGRDGKLEKRSSCKDFDDIINHGCSSKNKVKHDSESDHINTLAITKNHEELSKQERDRIKNGVVVTTAVVVREGHVNICDDDDVNKKEKNIGVKRTRDQFMNSTHGWTKDQELALERAYLEAKPTPHFWKKVSKLVPGKSAQECFDKIHGSHMTPPQPRVRSQARVSNPRNLSLSASKLLKTSSPTTKRPRYRKQKTHVVQRTVRYMLQNQYKAEQDSESDMFSLLEPTFSLSLNVNMVLTTPDRTQETDDVHKRCSSAHRSVSRFSGLHGTTTLVSPPVLKQVKNKALHEKYIDLLNCRETNRKAAKVDKSKVAKQEGSVERKEAIKAAKNALVFGAKNAIGEFQHQHATALIDLFDYESGADADEDNDQVL